MMDISSAVGTSLVFGLQQRTLSAARRTLSSAELRASCRVSKAEVVPRAEMGPSTVVVLKAELVPMVELPHGELPVVALWELMMQAQA